MSSASVVFVDTETTGLDPDRHELWEIALIVDGEEYQWLLEPSLKGADPRALQVSRFYERGAERREARLNTFPVTVAQTVATLTANRQLVGANPAFDAAFLARFLERYGQVPAWHYHPIDVKALAAGWIFCVAPALEMAPPWSTELLATKLGVDPESFVRHSALGDAQLAKAMYEAVTA